MRVVLRPIFLTALVSVTVFAEPRPAPPSSREREALTRALQSVIETTPLKTARVSVQVRSLDDGSVIYNRDGELT